jgi:hypothetical protein
LGGYNAHWLPVEVKQAMTSEHSSPSQDEPTSQNSLCAVVQRYQHAYRIWQAAVDTDQQAALREQLRDCHDALWPLLAPHLCNAARGWLNSGSGQDLRATSASYPTVADVLESLAMNLYLHVVDALPALDVNLDQNLLACLMVIARRGMSVEHHRVYSHSSRRPKPRTGDAASVSEVGTMWSTHTAQSTNAAWADGSSAEPPDPESCDLEERLVAMIYKQECWRAVQAYWRSTLSEVEHVIIKIRWRTLPPVAFETIAQQLGSGWTAGAVRQWHHRILSRRYQHLSDQGLVDTGGIA